MHRAASKWHVSHEQWSSKGSTGIAASHTLSPIKVKIWLPFYLTGCEHERQWHTSILRVFFFFWKKIISESTRYFFFLFLSTTLQILNGIGNTNGCPLSSTLFDVGKQLCKVFRIKCASTLRGITCWHSTWDDSCFLIDIQRKPIAGTPVHRGRDYLKRLEKPLRADKWRQLFQAIIFEIPSETQDLLEK